MPEIPFELTWQIPVHTVTVKEDVKLKRSFKINKQKQITRLNQRNKIIVTSMTSETMIDSGDEQETSEI